jgi:gas vesicle protein
MQEISPLKHLLRKGILHMNTMLGFLCRSLISPVQTDILIGRRKEDKAMDCNCIPQECVEEKRGSSFGSLLSGLLFGGLIGAGAALLATPRSGLENRNMIRDKSIELRNQAEQTVQDTRQRAEQLVQDTRQKVGDVAQRSMDQASDARNQGQSFFGQQKTNLESIVVGVREGVKTYADLNIPEQNPTDTEDFQMITPQQPGDIQTYSQNPLNPEG